jgi:hypothetical protein
MSKTQVLPSGASCPKVEKEIQRKDGHSSIATTKFEAMGDLRKVTNRA